MKKPIALFLCLVCLFVCCAALTVCYADNSGTCGSGVTWAFDESTGKLTISGSGKMADYTPYTAVPWSSQAGSITSIEIGNGITGIGQYAFYGCAMTGVSIPDSVTSIGEAAFNCSKLKSVTVPSSVTTIGQHAFRGCESLTSVNLPGTLKKIDDCVFFECRSLKEITLPAGVTSIGESAFRDCSELTSVTLRSTVTSIGESAFSGCTKLTSVTLPANATIGSGAFPSACTFTYASSCGDGVTWAFDESTGTLTISGSGKMDDYDNDTKKAPWISKIFSINAVKVESGVTHIGNYAFNNYQVLTDITISSGVKSIGAFAFAGNEHLPSVTLPDTVETIGASAFQDCDNLTRITIPSSVKTIGTSAFSSCDKLAEINILSGVETIGECAFYGCGINCKPINITIPASVTRIVDGAFTGVTADVIYGGCDESLFAAFTGLTVAYADHTWDAETGKCKVCSAECAHDKGWDAETGKCEICGIAHDHAESWSNGVCTICGHACPHTTHTTDGSCTVCDKTGISHSFTNYVSDGNASCTTDGTKTAKCDICDKTDTVADEGSKLAHSWDTATGTCTACHTACTHSYANGVCTVCGMTEPSDTTPPSETTPAPETTPVPETTPEPTPDSALPALQDMWLPAGEAVIYECDADVVWTSSNDKIVEVIGGKIVAKKAGSAVITAAKPDGRSVSCTVTVEKAELKLTFTNEKGTKTENFAEMKVGTTATLAAKNGKSCKFTSSDKKIVSVDKKTGELKAKKAGVVTITVKQGKKEASFTIEVKSVKISLNKTKVTLKKGETFQIVAEQKGVKDAKFTFKSDNKKIASVDKNSGLVTAKKKGTCTITVKSSYGQTATVTIKVKK